ncbi:hypothetical protein BU17DRAFT_70855 [Hysterangium stoloniferum]|nr:hypothetical protein BU17DRAFT_70855 [Hysterangium stoloniferum]
MSKNHLHRSHLLRWILKGSKFSKVNFGAYSRDNGTAARLGSEQGMSNIERDAIAAWKKPVIPNPTEVEWIGTELLYGTKISILVGMCLFNTRPVEEYEGMALNFMYNARK